MLIKSKILVLTAFLLLIFSAAPPSADAKPNEYKAIVKHLKTKYKAKKVKIPFIFLARFAVSVVRPAGVKSFSVTLFEDLKFSRETLDAEMQTAMRYSFAAPWSPIMRIRSRTGEQIYMYMREAESSVKIAIVTIDRQQAAVIRATFNSAKLAEFINDPKIFGISLGDDDKKTGRKKENLSVTEKAAAIELKDLPVREN